MSTITQEELKEKLNYDAKTGVFSNKNGRKVGSITDSGYITIRLFNKAYRAHRLAFLYMDGTFPDGEVDHVNRIKTDNRWSNIVPASSADNKKNRPIQSNNTSGFNGVSKYMNKWKAQIKINGKYLFLGYYETNFAAAYARHSANVKYGFSRRHGLG